MIRELEELKALMEKHNLSPGVVAQYIGCCQAQVYNWVRYQTATPSRIYQPKIRAAIRRIQREFESVPIGLEINRYYRAVWPILTRKEKDSVLGLLSESGAAFQPAYLKRLKDLAVAHHVKVEDVSKEEKK